MLFVGVRAQMIEAPVPTAEITNNKGETETLAEGDMYTGEAPLMARFMAEAEEYEGYSKVCTWTFGKEGDEEPFLTRYDDEVTYEFREAGSFTIVLYVTYTNSENPNEVLEYEYEPFVVTISESTLKVPNAFSPNGDGINDYFNVFDVKSIVSFSGAIYNRWGQQLFTWGIDEIGCEDCGWDGTYKGKDVKAGVYFVVISARGADGIEYDIKGDVNLLRDYIEDGAVQ